MNQRTHTWMAMRAIALMGDLGETPGLLRILKPHVRSTAIGAWIPDLQDSKKGSGDIDNHVMKMKPYAGALKGRFTVAKADLLRQLGPKRLMHRFIKLDTSLGSAWWNTPYKANPQPGQHLANRAMALTTTLIDQLILGDPIVAGAVPGTVRFARNLHPNARSRGEQVSTYFFMLSHFVADSCMPCHCDARSLFGYSNGLHKELERHWSRKVDAFFEKKSLLESSESTRKILDRARGVDSEFGIAFPRDIPSLRAGDVWNEIMAVCRGSFALANIMAPGSTYPFGRAVRTSFQKVFGEGNGPLLLKELDRTVAHDAVLNIAIVWKHIWETF